MVTLAALKGTGLRISSIIALSRYHIRFFVPDVTFIVIRWWYNKTKSGLFVEVCVSQLDRHTPLMMPWLHLRGKTLSVEKKNYYKWMSEEIIYSILYKNIHTILRNASTNI